MRRALLLLIAAAVSMTACDDGRPQAESTPSIPHVAPTYPDPYEQDTIDDYEIPVFKMSSADTPRWPSFRSSVGGLPVPRGWKLIDREANGYRLWETYQAPKGVMYDQVLAWYLTWFPVGKSWGGWTYCSQITGSGDAQLYKGVPENWAWRNPRNDHLIQIGLGGAPSGDAEGTIVSLYRSEFGEDCMQ